VIFGCEHYIYVVYKVEMLRSKYETLKQKKSYLYYYILKILAPQLLFRITVEAAESR
jgi:vacuolar-type H+-ATPase subunit D/Vma8